MQARVHILVSGRVQGVFFRDQTRRWASSLGIKGWVRNLIDGRVEVAAEGSRKNLEDFISRLEQGPPLSWVERADVTWEEFQSEFQDFRIIS